MPKFVRRSRKKFQYHFDDHHSKMPTIDIAVGLDQQTAARRAVRDSFLTPTSALLDTGSHRTFVDPQTVERLNLKPVTRRTVRSPLVPDGRPVWVVPIAVQILGKIGVKHRVIGEVHSLPAAITHVPAETLSAQGAPSIIIGRDVLGMLRFDYHGDQRRLFLYLMSQIKNDGIELRRRSS